MSHHYCTVCVLVLQEVESARGIAEEGVLLVAGASSNSLDQLLHTPQLRHLAGLADSPFTAAVELLDKHRWVGGHDGRLWLSAPCIKHRPSIRPMQLHMWAGMMPLEAVAVSSMRQALLMYTPMQSIPVFVK
jgi:hypothetical protein